MKCPQPQQLQKLLDEALPADQQQTIHAHLETCTLCQKTLERLAAGGATWDRAAQNLGAKPKSDETALVDAVEKLQGAPTNDMQTQAEAAATPLDEDLAFLQASEKPGSIGRLDKYEILSLVGKGGFGVVLKAFDESLHRVVAIKVMSPHMASNGTARQRFIREAHAAAAISHENVVTIHEVNKDAKIPYLAMQFVSGVTLQDKLESTGALGVKEILRIAMQMAEGLAAAHKQGYLHRDIKPANILLENGVERVKITDFGLARAVEDASVTQSGVIAGTPMFMSPEQANGEAVDARSDLFSLGSVLYVMCTGRPPFRATTTLAVLKRVIDDTPRPIREANPEIPEWLADIVTKLHAKKPADRYQTAKEVAELLGQRLADVQAGRAIGEPSRVSDRVESLDATTRPLTRHGSPGTRRRSAPVLAILLAIVGLPILLIAAIVVAYFAWQTPAVPNAIRPEEPGWVQLFNGKDVKGWKTHPDQPGGWTIEGENLVGRGPRAYLFSDRGDYENLHFRVVAKINANPNANSGQFFRAPFGFTRPAAEGQPKGLLGYEADICNYKNAWTGSLHYVVSGTNRVERVNVPEQLAPPDQWFTQEVIVKGNHIIIRVNDKEVVNHVDASHSFRKGHLVLQAMNPGTVVHVKKIEIKELPPDNPPLAVAPFDAAKAKEHQDAWAKHLGVKPEITNSIGMKLRLIPPGEFMMGSPKEEVDRLLVDAVDWEKFSLDSERPQRKASISAPFFMGTYEVTLGEFKRFVAETGHKTIAETNGTGGFRFDGQKVESKPEFTWRHAVDAPSDNHPVVQVALEDAKAFCTWLSKKEGRTYVIPDEARWEYACRAGTTTRWYCGDEEATVHDIAWIEPRTKGQTSAVGKKLPNAFGLYDMLGNVEEIALAGAGFVNRGGHAGHQARGARCANRYDPAIYALWFRRGFRVAIVGDLKAKSPPEEPGWVQLFNGKDLTGWTGDSKIWSWKNGELVGNTRVLGTKFKTPTGLFLTSTQAFKDFELKFQARLDDISAIAGIKVRGNIGVPIGIYRGGFFTAYPSINSLKPARNHDELNKVLKPGFNDFSLKCVGRHVTLNINGVTTIDDDFADIPRQGPLSFHATAWATRTPEVIFRDIKIKELRPTPPLALAPFDAAKAKEHQDAWAKHLGVEPEITNSIGMKLRLIPPGEFTMGSPPEEVTQLLAGPDADKLKSRFNQETPQRKVTIHEPFFFGAHEVTVADFRAFVEALGYRTTAELDGKGGQSYKDGKVEKRPEWVWKHPDFAQSDHHPVVFVSRKDALAFCRWLSAKEGRDYRLPDQEQWEYACRAGTTTRWQSGDDPDQLEEVAWFNLPRGASAKVGQRKPNAFGLFDMHGNVLEWTASPNGASWFFARGGSYASRPVELRSAFRDFRVETHADSSTGFRVAIVGKLKPKTPSTEPGWVQLFNGKDLTGWKADQPDQWKAENGQLIGHGGKAYLWLTDRKFKDFHCRVEAKINANGWADVVFRNSPDSHASASICPTQGRTGSLFFFAKEKNQLLQQPEKEPASADTWLTLEVIVQGNKVTILVNGVQTAQASIADLPERGPLFLAAEAPGTIVCFRKIEIKELPPETPDVKGRNEKKIAPP